eukprot:6200019-Lingulodinium_polyedra.AAC.1
MEEWAAGWRRRTVPDGRLCLSHARTIFEEEAQVLRDAKRELAKEEVAATHMEIARLQQEGKRAR